MAFVYDLSRVKAEYCNSCIRASTTAAIGYPSARIPASFQLLVDELKWGRYRGQSLSSSLQTLLEPSIQFNHPPPAAPLQDRNQHRNQEAERGGGSGRKGNKVQNPRLIQCLKLRARENTRGALRYVAICTVGGCIFCKRWHLGGSCFTRCPRVGSRVYPPVGTIDTVDSTLMVERTAAATVVG